MFFYIGGVSVVYKDTKEPYFSPKSNDPARATLIIIKALSVLFPKR